MRSLIVSGGIGICVEFVKKYMEGSYELEVMRLMDDGERLIVGCYDEYVLFVDRDCEGRRCVVRCV